MKLSQLSLADYNQLDSIPVINQDLSASGFTPVANTYYRHTGATTATFTQGVIYLYDTAYHKLGESGGTTLNKYELHITDFKPNYLSRKLVGNIAQQAVSFQCLEMNHYCTLSRGCNGDDRVLTGAGLSGQNLVNIVMDINSVGGVVISNLYTMKTDGTITKETYDYSSEFVITYWNYTEITL